MYWKLSLSANTNFIFFKKKINSNFRDHFSNHHKMSFSALLPTALNAAWTPPSNPNDEVKTWYFFYLFILKEALEQEEMAYEEELKNV